MVELSNPAVAAPILKLWPEKPIAGRFAARSADLTLLTNCDFARGEPSCHWNKGPDLSPLLDKYVKKALIGHISSPVLPITTPCTNSLLISLALFYSQWNYWLCFGIINSYVAVRKVWIWIVWVFTGDFCFACMVKREKRCQWCCPQHYVIKRLSSSTHPNCFYFPQDWRSDGKT